MTDNVIKFPCRCNITDAVRYLETGGMDDLIKLTSAYLETNQPHVSCDTDVMYALVIMAQRYMNGEKR